MTKKDERKIIIVLTVACVAAFFIFRHNKWPLVLALFLILSEIIGGKLPNLIARGWKKLALLLGNLNSRILLTLAFYLFLTPIASLFRIFNRKSPAHFLVDGRESLFEDIPTVRDTSTLLQDKNNDIRTGRDLPGKIDGGTVAGRRPVSNGVKTRCDKRMFEKMW